MSAFDVFVSHSTRNKNVADAVTGYLEGTGQRCWIAPRNIEPGENYGEAILRGIYGCRVFVLVFSDHANQSRHVLKEVERAINADKVIIPFRIEAAMPSGAMEYFLSTDQWLDALSAPLEPHLAHLQKTIAGVLGNKATQTAATLSAEEFRQAAQEMDELAPDDWAGNGSSIWKKMHNFLLGDRE